jgi:hypothetical protein
MFNANNFNPNAGNSIPKVLNPGSHIARIVNLALDEPPYAAGKGSYFINVLLEGQAQGEGFDGILIDKTNPSLGKYQGQIATVKSGRYPFSNFEYQGKTITRDEQMFRFIMNLATQLGVLESIQNEGVTGSTIEEYFENVKPYLINRWAFFTIAGQEYFTEGYDRPNYRLFFPKSKGKVFPFSSLKNEAGEVIQFLKFDQAEHIVAASPSSSAESAPAVDSFAPAGDSFGSAPAPQPGADLFAPAAAPAAPSSAPAPQTAPAPAAAPAPTVTIPSDQSFAAFADQSAAAGADLKLPF